jgi:hypothetical protein
MPWLMYKFCPYCKSIDLVDMLMKRCYSCSNNYLDETAIPDRTLKPLAKDYNYRKINYIGKQNSR